MLRRFASHEVFARDKESLRGEDSMPVVANGSTLDGLT
jgi:hypothetical protein